MTPYYVALCNAMGELGKLPNTIFVGQGVGCAGTTMTDTMSGVSKDKLLEFPVAEDFQLGFCIGLSLQGLLPICIYARWNFALLAANQLVNHLDRLPLMGYEPNKVIIRVQVPLTHPFDPGPQHDDDFTDAFESMLRTVQVVRLGSADSVEEMYRRATQATCSTVMVEYAELYGAIPSGVAMGEKH